MDNDYVVRMIQFTGDIHGAVRVDNDGFASIYINDDLSREARQRAFRHEIEHLTHDDLYSCEGIYDVEHRPKHQNLP